jgi:O-antigen/teichoic acid export membrane protein
VPVNNTLSRAIFHLLSLNGIGYLLLLLISIIIFRSVDKTYYGLYVIMLSLFAVIELLMAGFNDTIVRFLKDKISLNDKQNIVLFILVYKYLLILMFIIFIYLAKYYGFFELLIGNYIEVSDVIDNYLVVVILNGILSIFIGVNNSILNSQEKYKLTANIGLARNAVYFTIVLGLSFYTTNYLYYLHASIALSAAILIYLILKIFKDFREFSILNIIKTDLKFDVGRKYIYPYATPLTASSLLTYIKNYLPIIILGKEFSLENVAIFSIIKTFFKALHSLTSSFIDPMMSKFLELKDQPKVFKKNIGTMFWSMLIFRVIIFSILALLMKYIFIIYNLDNTKVNQFIFYVLGVEFIIAGMILIYGIILRLEKSTYKVFQASIARFCVELSLIYLILFDFGVIAAALILLVSRYIETLTMYFLVRDQKIFKFSSVILLCFLVIVIYYLSQLPVIFSLIL